MSGLPPPPPISTGAARRARERQCRAQARHVRWLIGLQQAEQSHHTAPRRPGEAAADWCGQVEALKAEVSELRGLFIALKAEALKVAAQVSAEPPSLTQLKADYKAKFGKEADAEDSGTEEDGDRIATGDTAENLGLQDTIDVARELPGEGQWEPLPTRPARPVGIARPQDPVDLHLRQAAAVRSACTIASITTDKVGNGVKTDRYSSKADGWRKGKAIADQCDLCGYYFPDDTICIKRGTSSSFDSLCVECWRRRFPQGLLAPDR